MITAELTRTNLEYDMNALLKSFYPSEEVKMVGIEAEEGVLLVRILKDGAVLTELSLPDEYDSNKSVFKNEIRRRLYKDLEKKNGHGLPWGILNGIRPTKLVMKEILSGKSDEEAVAFMKDTYLASDEKARLAVRIAKNERAVIERSRGKDGWSLYIGIPFCPTTCMYCSFTSYAISLWKDRVGEYLEAMFKEIDAAADIMGGKNPDTIYIGGGTPTTLEAEEFERLFKKLEETFDMDSLLEFTV
nr:coproporphyrinogen dehydrogenase HemZ [Lachnospiraceae bacterium]